MELEVALGRVSFLGPPCPLRCAAGGLRGQARVTGQTRHSGRHGGHLPLLCRYLSEDGLTLMAEPQNIWRLPTTDEIVRSLIRAGENTGCTWDGESGGAACIRQPNKDTPLWAPDEEPIYYWSADEYDDESAWYVPFTGGGRYGGAIGYQPKEWENPRHGYRCVRAP